MPDPVEAVQARRVRRFSISIPANASAADTLLNLAIAAGLSTAEKSNVVGATVWGLGLACIAGDSTSSLPLPLAAAANYTEPATNFAAATYIKSTAGATTATLSVYLMGQAP